MISSKSISKVGIYDVPIKININTSQPEDSEVYSSKTQNILKGNITKHKKSYH